MAYPPMCLKRIQADMKELYKEPLDVSESIYHHFNEANMTEAHFMIIGPEGTPYENGFYFFHFVFPPQYPFVPPIVSFCTLDGPMRFNPNLYNTGKVCLSMLNTWEGPQWTSCLTVRTILLALRAMVLGTANPLHNEPGLEGITDKRNHTYSEVVRHENFRVAVVKMLKRPPEPFKVFRSAMFAYILQKEQWYAETMRTLSLTHDGTFLTCDVYNLHVECHYATLLEGLHVLIHRKTPLECPKDFEVGVEMPAPKDGRFYVVKMVGKPPKAFKRWVLK
jgi:ubiquitin-conjugating enzyme E2 Z